MDTERFKLLRQAIDLILSDTLVPAQALDTLNNEWRYTTRQTKERAGGPLARASFYGLLCNPFIKGMCRHAGSLYPGTHPALVTAEEFDRLQAIIARREKHRKHSPKLEMTPNARFYRHEYAFTGWLGCAHCGLGMVTGSCAKGHIYYHCSNQQGVCTKKGVREETIISEIAPLLDKVRLPERLGAQLLTLTERHLMEQGILSEERQAGTKARRETALDQINAQRLKLRALLLRDVLSEADYVAEKARLDREEDALTGNQSGYSSHEESLERMLHAAREAIDFAQTAPLTFAAALPDEKRHIVRYLSGAMLPEGAHPRPRLDISRTEKKVLLEPHPYLVPFMTYAEPLQSVEPVKSGSGKQKRPTHSQSFLFGRPEESLNEFVKAFCCQIQRPDLYDFSRIGH